jgi:hypothetical protein
MLTLPGSWPLQLKELEAVKGMFVIALIEVPSGGMTSIDTAVAGVLLEDVTVPETLIVRPF